MPGGNAALGTITSAGVYTAPPDLPVNPAPQVTARSHADTTKTASANITIASDVELRLSAGSAAVELGATRNFRASISSAGHPDAAVRWSLSGEACPSACGVVDVNGNFTAPQVLPSSATATLMAQSVADPSQKASATITITSTFTVQISAPSSVPVNGSAAITAMLTPVAGSNPAQAVTWSLAGSGCSGAACGVLTVLTQQSAGGGATANTATYHAPAIVPSPSAVAIIATPQADPTKKASATLVIEPSGSVSVSPATATLAAKHRITLMAQVGSASGGASGMPGGVTWSVNGIAGGNAAVGQICGVATNPCQPVTSGTAAQVDYIAPGAIPSPNPVTVQATNAADSTKSASAQITILNHVLVTVQPASVTLAPLAVQGFTASVIGASDQRVVWQVQGTACAPGGAAVCGSIAPNGRVHRARRSAIAELAASGGDQRRRHVAIGLRQRIDLERRKHIVAASSQRLRGRGGGIRAPRRRKRVRGGEPRTGVGAARSQDRANHDVHFGRRVHRANHGGRRGDAGNVSVQVRNPNGTKSNSVSLVVAPPNVSDEVIALTNAAPTATAKDIVVVELTTAGVSVPGNDVDMNLAALGSFSTTNNSCSLTGNPVQLQRPAEWRLDGGCLPFFRERTGHQHDVQRFRVRPISPCCRSSLWVSASCG